MLCYVYSRLGDKFEFNLNFEEIMIIGRENGLRMVFENCADLCK